MTSPTACASCSPNNHYPTGMPPATSIYGSSATGPDACPPPTPTPCATTTPTTSRPPRNAWRPPTSTPRTSSDATDRHRPHAPIHANQHRGHRLHRQLPHPRPLDANRAPAAPDPRGPRRDPTRPLDSERLDSCPTTTRHATSAPDPASTCMTPSTSTAGTSPASGATTTPPAASTPSCGATPAPATRPTSGLSLIH